MQHGRYVRRIWALALAGLAIGAFVAGSSSGVGAAEDFVLGSGNAQAQLVRIGPAAGHLALAPTIGLSLADYLNTLGRGDSRIFEWGALDGSVPADFKARTPSVRAQSTDEKPSGDASPIGTPPGSPFTAALMQQHADAKTAPVGHSSFTLGAFGIPGQLEMSGGVADSSAGVVKDGVREAHGTVRIGRLVLGGGAVTLTGLKWEAIQRTGAETVTTASFSVEGATAGGQTLAPPKPDQVTAFFATLNTALAPTGLVLDPPATSTAGGLAAVSPLGIRVVNSPIGNTAVAPVVGALQPVREPITGGLITNCAQCSSGVLVADVFAGVVTGGGRFDLELGGANGYTEGTRYDMPFNFDFSAFTTSDVGPTNDFASGGSDFFSNSPSSFATSAPTADVGTVASATTPAAAGTGAGGGGKRPGLTGVTAGTSRPSVPGKKGGAAAAVGLAGLLGALALAGADYRSIRTARRTIPS